MTEILEQLESNDKAIAEAAKEKVCEIFATVKDPWLVNGLFDRYLQTSSIRIIEILVNLIDTHHSFLFDKLNEAIKNSNIDIKVKSLTLLGHVVRNQPMWLYKICEHSLLKNILTLLKSEVEILPLISALLVVIVLIPMIPSSISDFLSDIFEIFSRLASWNCTSEKLMQDYLEHLQMALYALFIRLYGMFPCNFIAYLRTQYREKQRAIFGHTIKPMLTTVRMHPSLVTSSKDTESTPERWKSMSVHDIIVDCERFSLDASDRCCHDTHCHSSSSSSGFRSRSGTNNTSLEKSYQNLKSITGLPTTDMEFFTADSIIRSDSPVKPLAIRPANLPNLEPREVSPNNAVVKGRPMLVPSSPLRIIPPSSFAVFPPRGAGDHPPDSPCCCEDDEVSSINNDDASTKNNTSNRQQQCDSVLHDNNCEGGEENNSDDSEEHGSPCTAGGLHMPNIAARKRVLRLRYYSLSYSDQRDKQQVSSGSSPGNGIIPFAENSMVRRASSCPEIKKSPVSVRGDSISNTLEETDEEIVPPVMGQNGLIKKLSERKKHCVEMETQTDNFWPMPYEHLFLDIFPPQLESGDKASPTQPQQGMIIDRGQPSVYDIFDRYMESACNFNADRMKDRIQLQLLYQQLLFERSRRETHAYRNRRLLADAKNIRLLEEYNSALKDQIQLQQREISELRTQLETMREKQRSEKSQNASSSVDFLQKQNESLLEECKELQKHSRQLESELNDVKEKCKKSAEHQRNAEEKLRDARAEISSMKEQIEAGEKRKTQVEALKMKMLMANELLIKYQQKLSCETQKPDHGDELDLLRETYQSEVKGFQQALDQKNLIIEANNSRIAEFEQKVTYLEKVTNELKRELDGANKVHKDQLTTMNERYQNQVGVNITLEERMLELLQTVDARQESTRSPDLSSCQEVIASPLSLSIEGTGKQLDPQDFHSLQDTVSGIREEVLDSGSLEGETTPEVDFLEGSHSSNVEVMFPLQMSQRAVQQEEVKRGGNIGEFDCGRRQSGNKGTPSKSSRPDGK